jgi:hypothetical protein
MDLLEWAAEADPHMALRMRRDPRPVAELLRSRAADGKPVRIGAGLAAELADYLETLATVTASKVRRLPARLATVSERDSRPTVAAYYRFQRSYLRLLRSADDGTLGEEFRRDLRRPRQAAIEQTARKFNLSKRAVERAIARAK